MHVAKLAADFGGAALSTVLLWRGHRRAGLAVRYLLPPIGSALVLSRADLDRLADTGRGRYAAAYLSPAAQATRLAGDTVMMWGAGRRSWPMVATGLGIVALGWSSGIFSPRKVAAPDAAGTGYRPVPQRGGW